MHTHLQVAIYHDPGKGTNTEGQTIKQLKIQPTPDGKVSSLAAMLLHCIHHAAGPLTLTSVMPCHAGLHV